MIDQIDFGNIPRLEFVDRTGVWRSTMGCSLVGRQEFWYRLDLLAKTLQSSPELSVSELYQGDRLFSRNCDECLKLNGIDPEWLDGQGMMLTTFLFDHDGQMGALVRLNTPDKPTEPPSKKKEKPGTIYDAIAALWSGHDDLEQAIAIATNPQYPAKVIDRVLASRAEQSLSPEEREKKEMFRQARAAQEAIAAEGIGNYMTRVAMGAAGQNQAQGDRLVQTLRK